MRSWISLAASFLCLAAMIGADEYRRAPRFEGKSIPNPPEQGKPWTVPETKLPRFLKTAASLLFDEGVADPRGCEYREVEVGEVMIVKTRGWVLPEKPGETHRYVVGWNGVIYPATKVGDQADLDADVRALAEPKPDARNAARGRSMGMMGGDPSHGVSVEDQSRLKVVMLLRLGRADLAESLFAAWTGWKPDRAGRDLTDYGVTYLTLAQEWASTVHSRLMSAHVGGDDVVALDAARRLSAFAKLAEAKAEELGFQRPGQDFSRDGRASYFQLTQLAEVLADQERRASMPPRTPIPKHGTDPKARVAALIRDLDQIHVEQMSSPGSAYPGNHEYVRELIREGESAVEPLLAALETDTRLTRSASMHRGRGGYSHVHSVHEAELAALNGLIPTAARKYQDLRNRMPATRKDLVRALRSDWGQVRGMPEAESWFRILADDRAGSERWLEAATWMAQDNDDPVAPGLVRYTQVTRTRKPGEVVPKKGDPLRARRAPSITELMVKRARASIDQSPGGGGLAGACGIGSVLIRWDERAAPPVLKDLMHACRQQFEAEANNESQTRVPIAAFSAFTLFLAKAGDLAALDEYAEFIATTTPKRLAYVTAAAFEPMWLHAAHPSIAAVSRKLFADPKSPWIEAFRQAGPTGNHWGDDALSLIYSPMIRVPALREGLAALLDDRTEVGTITRTEQPNSYTFKLKTSQGNSGSFGGSGPVDPDAPGVGVETPFRVCDVVATQLASLDGTPPCATHWSLARRDAAIKACAQVLAKYGERYADVRLPGVEDWGRKVAHLKFASLDRPATAEEATKGLAIFSLEGQGEARVVKMPPFPLHAKWVTNKDFPIDQPQGNGKVERSYDQDGTVWQAEEVRVGDRWERSYGFVGNSVVARVPASEIEFGPQYFSGTHLPEALDARLLPEPLTYQLKSGGPAVVTLHLFNRRGLLRAVPTEFVRDGKALRRGMTIGVEYLPKEEADKAHTLDAKWRPVTSKPTDVFEPGDGSKTLEASEEFEAFRIDLAERFDLSKPGTYRVTVTFDEKSGLGPGKVAWMFSNVGDGEDE